MMALIKCQLYNKLIIINVINKIIKSVRIRYRRCSALKQLVHSQKNSFTSEKKNDNCKMILCSEINYGNIKYRLLHIIRRIGNRLVIDLV